MLGCITEREDPADALVLHAKNKHLNLATLPEGAVVGHQFATAPCPVAISLPPFGVQGRPRQRHYPSGETR
jgi:hypothetical protein